MHFVMTSPSGPAQAQDYCVIWHGDALLLPDSGLPRIGQLPLTGLRHLGELAGQRCFVGEWVGPLPAGWRSLSLRQALAGQAPADWAGLLSRARMLRTFDRTHRYCSACATPLRDHDHDHGKVCPSCGLLSYPKLSPAMMALVVRDRQLLLARSPHFPPGVYSALAGFVEPGETLEACVHREVQEEVGVRIHNLRYLGSQGWPFPHSLMLAFVADYLDGEITPQAGEIESAQWFDLDQLPALPSQASIAHSLIHRAVAMLNGQPLADDAAELRYARAAP